jgi:ribosomal protein L21E
VGGQQLREVLSSLCRDVRLDLTRKQLTRDLVAWTVRIDGTESVRRGRVVAQFRHGQLVHLQIGPAAG